MWNFEEREGLYRDGLRIRAIAASAFLAFFLVGGLFGWSSKIEGYVLVVSALAALVVINPLLWAIGVARRFPLRDFYVHWVFDVAAVSVGVYGMGLFDIPLVSVAYMIMIVSSAAFVTMTAAMCLAAGSSISWLVLWMCVSMGWLAHKHVDFGVHWELEGESFLTIASMVFFFLFAYVSGSIAEKLRNKSMRLLENQRRLEAAMESERQSRNRVELLSAIVQHDVHGPLSVIGGAASEAGRAVTLGSLSDAQRFLRIIEQRLPAVSSAVESLGLFRVEAGDRCRGSVPVQEVVQSVFVDLRGEIEDRCISTSTRGENLAVELERRRLYHVLRNLISNAIKCAPDDGTGSVSVEITRDRAAVRISVSDNGPGLSDALIGALTGESIRTHIERDASRSGGLGVGLSLARSIVEAWGGRLEYAAREGGGAKVSLLAPPSSP